MRRWIRSARPDSKRTIRYLPRRSTARTRSPWSSAATSTGSTGRVSRASEISTRSNRRPASTGSSRRRTVSTSGSSGTRLVRGDHVEHDVALGRRLVRDRVGGTELDLRLRRRGLGRRVDLGEWLPAADAVAALAQAEDPDAVVDRVVFGPAAGAKVQRRLADRDGTERVHVARSVGEHLLPDGRRRQHVLRRVAALRADPALVRLEGRAVGDRLHRPDAALLLVDPEVGDREQPRARGEHELEEVARPLALDRRDRLPDLKRVPDRAPERLV